MKSLVVCSAAARTLGRGRRSGVMRSPIAAVGPVLVRAAPVELHPDLYSR